MLVDSSTYPSKTGSDELSEVSGESISVSAGRKSMIPSDN